MKLRSLLDLLRRPAHPAPAAPPDAPCPAEDSVYLPAEPPAPDTDPGDLWCARPAAADPAALAAALEGAVAARQAALDAAWARSEDPWRALHAQPGTVPAT